LVKHGNLLWNLWGRGIWVKLGVGPDLLRPYLSIDPHGAGVTHACAALPIMEGPDEGPQ
jgi:hypothetical protein